MNFKSRAIIIATIFTFHSIGATACLTAAKTLLGQKVLQITAGNNGGGLNQNVGYFQIAGTGEGSGCSYGFLLDDLGKVYYSTLLTAFSTGASIDFWTAGTTSITWLPGGIQGNTVATINIHN